MAFFNNLKAAQEFVGTVSEYDQVDYQGSLSKYDFVLNADNTITVSRKNWGTDTLTSIEGIWFRGEQAWYSMADAIRLTGDTTTTPETGGTLIDGVITGDVNANNLIGDTANNIFYGGQGNDVMNGNGGNNDVVNFDGELIEYTITRVTNDTTTFSHPTWGENTLIDIDRVAFLRDESEYSIAEAIDGTQGLPTFRIDADGVINGTPLKDAMRGTKADELFYGGTGNDLFNGKGGFDQVNFDGALADYVVSMNRNGAFVFEHPIWGIDVLKNIEGIFMAGEGVWYPVIAATFGL